MADPSRRGVAESVEGLSNQDLRLLDWGQLVLVAAIFGSAFLWIALALRSIAPETIAFGRVATGAAALWLVPAARCRIARADWSRLLVASVVGIAAPVLLFGFAEQRISSALAGMLVSGLPLMAAVVAAIETRALPRSQRLAGLAIGLVGMALVAGPVLTDVGSQARGVVMVLIAVLCYAVATTLYAPLQQTYGSLSVTLWVLTVSAVMLSPLGLVGLGDSRVEALPIIALLVLGVAGTGFVWAAFVGLVGRIGAVRSSIAGYLIPIVALMLGVLLLDERVGWIQVAGVGIALSGGYMISKHPHRPTGSPQDRALISSSEYVPAALEMCR